MLRLSRFVLRHKVAVVLFWLAVLVVGGAASSRVPDRLARDFSFPGQPGYEGNIAILRTYGNGGPANPLVPVVTLPVGTTVDSPRVRVALGQAFDRLAADPRARLRVLSCASTGDRGLVTAGGRTTFAVVFPPYRAQQGPDPTLAPAIADTLRRALPPGTTVRVTGLDELSTQAVASRESGVLAETLVGGLGGLVVLAFVFGSALAFMPLVVALFSILGLAVLAVVPVPFLRSVGFGSMLIPLVSTLVTLTLLPVLLATIGPRLDRLLPALLLAAALLVGCADDGGGQHETTSGPPAKGVTQVVARQTRFSPAAIQVPAGTRVTWIFRDGDVPHNVKGDGWSSGKPQTSGTFSHTFDQPGTYEYACTLHPRMTGRIVVTHAIVK